MSQTKVAGVSVQTKVLAVPSCEEVRTASRVGRPITIQLGTYHDGVETVSNIMLDELRMIVREAGGGYEFTGTYYDMALQAADSGDEHLMIAERGPCRVNVKPSGEVEIRFIISLSFALTTNEPHT